MSGHPHLFHRLVSHDRRRSSQMLEDSCACQFGGANFLKSFQTKWLFLICVPDVVLVRGLISRCGINLDSGLFH
jgi:hypothetical protein